MDNTLASDLSVSTSAAKPPGTGRTVGEVGELEGNANMPGADLSSNDPRGSGAGLGAVGLGGTGGCWGLAKRADFGPVPALNGPPAKNTRLRSRDGLGGR